MASKIKVDTIENVAGSGNVSLGSGHNLVVPGNITGQGTTTLTGNLTVDTNTLHVNASNNRVGVGTTSPADHLSVVTAGANAQLSVDRSDGASGRTVLIHSSTGGQLQTTGSVPLIFGTADIEQMRIDASGRVTKPNQPLAVAYYSASTQDGAYAAVNRNNIVCKPGATRINVGNLYNTSNGRFTAPVAGRYVIMFNGSQYTQNINSYFNLRFLKNGSAQKDTYTNKVGTWHNLSGFHIFNCAANDYMEVKASHDNNAAANRGGFDVNTYTNFICYLLT